MKTIRLYLAFLLPFLMLTGCSPTIAAFDQTAYTQVTALKVDALNLMDKATENYASHESDVQTLQVQMDKAIEYDKHRPHNEITSQMWTILSDPQGHLYGGFLVLWKKQGKCSATYVAEKKKQIGSSFDQIAELESRKIKPSQVTATP